MVWELQQRIYVYDNLRDKIEIIALMDTFSFVFISYGKWYGVISFDFFSTVMSGFMKQAQYINTFNFE